MATWLAAQAHSRYNSDRASPDSSRAPTLHQTSSATATSALSPHPDDRYTAETRAESRADSNYYRCANEKLYEAYSDLHNLAQDFEKPFDAPAILVVGQQTDGKSGVCHFIP